MLDPRRKSSDGTAAKSETPKYLRIWSSKFMELL